MARRRYGTFTPARRAALRKAQLRSAELRRMQGRRATQIKYAKRAAVGVGVLGAVAGAGYAGHKAAGGKMIVSTRTPTVIHHATGKAIGPTGFRVRGKAVTYTSRNKMGDKTLLYAVGVNRNKVHGKKIRGGPQTVKQYKPTNADLKNMARHNRPLPHTEQYAREAMMVGHTTAHTYVNRKLEANEVIRRTKSYTSAMESKGKKVSAAHHMAASKYYSGQPRYTGGTVKPLKRLSRRKARRLSNRLNSYTTPTVLGSRKRQPKAS
jgi:hypothetical protein